MSKTIALTNEMEMPRSRFNADLVREGQSRLVKRNLRFDNSTGKVRDNTGVICQYVTASDFVPHATVEDVIRWEFSRFVNNEAWHVLVERVGIDAALIQAR